MVEGLIGIWVLLAIVVGLAARKTVVKFWGGFVLSILLTPLISIIIIEALPLSSHK